MTGTRLTEEKVERLQRLKAAGRYSHSEIAWMMDISANAVSGKVHDLKLAAGGVARPVKGLRLEPASCFVIAVGIPRANISQAYKPLSMADHQAALRGAA